MIQSMKVSTFRLNYAFLFVLITTFLTMQWTTAHIHLVKKHNHDEIRHLHQIEEHAHNLTDQYVSDITSTKTVSHTNVIELDHNCSLQKSKTQKNSSFAVALTVSYSLPPLLLFSIKIPVYTDAKLDYFDRLTVNPRAPPQTS